MDSLKIWSKSVAPFVVGVIAALFSWFSIRAEANLARQQHLLAPIESVSVPDAEPPSNDITDLQQLG